MRKFYVFLATMLVAMFSFGAMAEDPYVFVGACNSWDLAGAPEFVKQADGTYKIDKIDKIVGAFKVVKGHDWSKPQYASNGSAIDVGVEYKLKPGGGDLSFTNSSVSYADCSLTLRVDGSDHYLTITGTPKAVEVGVWCLCGSFNEWAIGSAPEFTKTAEDIYEITVGELSGEFGIFADHAWDISFKKNASGESLELNVPYSLGSGKDLCFADPATVYVNCKLVLNTTGGVATLTATAESVVEATPGYQLVGDYNGWKLETGEMTMVSDGHYEIALESFAGEFKITKNRSWNNALCSNGTAMALNEEYLPIISSDSGNNLVINQGEEITDFHLYVDVTDNKNPKITATGVSGNKLVEIDGVGVKAHDGVISVSGTDSVAVYTAGGAIISTSGDTAVAPGLYIVKAGSKVLKVVVR